MSVSSDHAQKPACGPPRLPGRLRNVLAQGKCLLPGKKRRRDMGGSCRFLAPSTTDVFRRRQQETLPKINRSSTISQDLTSSLRGGARGRSTQGRGPSSPVPRAQPHTGHWFPPLAGKLNGCGCQFSLGQARKQESQVSEAKGTGSAGEGSAKKTTGLGVWSQLPSRMGDGGVR